jgi:long-subunit fatty acid transport protein
MPPLIPPRTGKILLVFSLGITPTWAGGLYVREYGQPNQAASGAGGNVFAEDASTAFQNPSGLFNLEKDSNWMVTGVVVDSKVEFETTKATTVPGMMAVMRGIHSAVAPCFTRDDCQTGGV